MTARPILINGTWRASLGSTVFHAVDPQTGSALPDAYPVSPWSEVEECLNAAATAAMKTRNWPGDRFAAFLERYAELIEARTSDLVHLAHRETALPVQPRLRDVELPRTINQLRQAAAAARDGSWVDATIDSKMNIRSQREPIGPVAIFGPNNFPFAFNSIAGGDFAAAVAAGNPVIAKAHSSHPGTTRLFAEAAHQAAQETGLPAGFIQMIYRMTHDNGCRLVADSRLGAAAYTGSRSAGLALKAAADAVGKPIYLELSSINPVVLLPGAIAERRSELAEQFTASCLMGSGQFCTNPGLVMALAGADTEELLCEVAQRFIKTPVAPLLSEGVLKHLQAAVRILRESGAALVAGGESCSGSGFGFQNTLLRVSGKTFLGHPRELQTEAFGNASLWVIFDSADELLTGLAVLEGNLTGSIYSALDGRDDELYAQVAAILRPKVGRLLNDKMPTGVAVVPAMNHGGPFPATGHPGFTAVGIPAALRRFTQLACYDNVRMNRLPRNLQNPNPTGSMWRLVDGQWTQGHVPLCT